MQAGWNVVKCSYGAFVLCVYRESNVSPDTCAAGAAPEDRRTGTGDAFLCAAGA